MNFEEFIKEVKDSIREYLPSEYKDARIWTENNRKLNEQYTGLMISNGKDALVPMINLDHLYESYRRHPERGISGLLEKAASILQMERPYYAAEKLLHYEQIKDNLFFRVSSAEKNKELLENIPHEIREDIALTVHIALSIDKEETASVTVTNQMLENYGISAEKLFQDARISSPIELPPIVENMDDMLHAMMLADMKASGMNQKELDEMEKEMAAMDKSPMVIVSNEERADGASALFYPGMMDQIGERMNGDYYILPSSIHEMIVVPDDGDIDFRDLKAMVKEINATQVSPEERLTDEVYHYDSKDRVFEKASAFEERKKTKELGITSAEKGVQITGGKPKHKSAEMSL